MIHVVLTMTLLTAAHILCLDAMTERKYSLRKTLLAYLLFFCCFICASAASNLALGDRPGTMAFVAFCVTFTLYFAVFVVISKDPFCKKLFLQISYGTVFVVFHTASMLICKVWFPQLSATGVLYARNLIRSFLYLPIIWVYYKCFKPALRRIPGTKKTWYTISVPPALFLAVFVLLMMAISDDRYPTEQYVLFFAAVVLVYCSVVWMIFEVIRYMEAENRMELIDQNMKYLQIQLEFAKEDELRAKMIRHDYRHHNRSLASLLKDGKTQEALAYIEQYEASLKEGASVGFCPHAAVNAILNYFYLRAQSEGMTAEFQADVPCDSTVTDPDYAAILSNLLENAFNGCRECKGSGKISLHIRAVAGKIVVVCSNPCRPDLEIEDHMLREKGVGVESMIAAAEKYGGDIRYEKKDGVLTVCIILKC